MRNQSRSLRLIETKAAIPEGLDTGFYRIVMAGRLRQAHAHGLVPVVPAIF
jgi:hypothetical protein